REGVQGMGRARLRLAIDRLQGLGGIGDWAFLANQTLTTSALVLGSDGDLDTARSLLGHLERHGDDPWPEVAAHLVDELGAGSTDPHPPDALDAALRLASTALAGST
ncbi:MAG: hypothetical protein AB1Z55_03975, partial [Acidimicrobiia bacterium]